MENKKSSLLGPVQIREIAQRLQIHPSKARGQNFVHSATTVQKIVREAAVQPGEKILEIGPGLGSLTLALLEAGAQVAAVEIDAVLAQELPRTMQEFQPAAVQRFGVVQADALEIAAATDLPRPPASAAEVFFPQKLVANLPYNLAVPILLTLLENIPSLQAATVMVQAEVAERLTAQPGSRIYGVPSVKSAWYGTMRRGSKISRQVFWPVPNVDSLLVHFQRHNEPLPGDRAEIFAIIEAAFSQRRKTLRAALTPWAGSAARAETIIRAAGLDPRWRGEKLQIADFAALAAASHSN